MNPEAFGLSGINPITCVKTLAHELGHILGAGQSNRSWWNGWWIFKFQYYAIVCALLDVFLPLSLLFTR